MALSPDKLQAYRPLLAVLVAELVAEYEAERHGNDAPEQTIPDAPDHAEVSP